MPVANRPDDWNDPVSIPTVTAPERVLVPFDGSHAAERALAWAALVATNAASEVVVVVAFEPPLTMRGRGAAYVEEQRHDLGVEAEQLATEAVSLLHAREVRARGIVVKGDPARAILDVVEDEACDLVVLGRTGLTAEVGGVVGKIDRFREMLNGGVSEKVARYAPVPVLVVS